MKGFKSATMLYRKGTQERLHDVHVDTCVVDADQVEEALDDGWHRSPADVKKAEGSERAAYEAREQRRTEEREAQERLDREASERRAEDLRAIAAHAAAERVAEERAAASRAEQESKEKAAAVAKKSTAKSE